MVEKGRLGALAARPPTPPRSSSYSGSRTRETHPETEPQLPPTSAHDHPSSSDTSPSRFAERALKRVNFSPLPSYIKAPDFSTSPPQARPQLRNLYPSKHYQPTKSILKPTVYVSHNDAPEDPRSSPTDTPPGMLYSILQQLAGDCKISRTDAYMQLLGSLAVYSDVPDTEDLVDNIGRLTQFMRRDIAVSSSTPGPSEVSLIHHASNLLCMMLWKPDCANRIPDDFKNFVLDLAIGSLQNPSTPKTIIIDYMRILSEQNFPPKVLTSTKTAQLLQNLNDITSRLNGKSIIAMRLSIYEKLLLQARSVIASYSNLWMNHLISGLLHKVKDIRFRALKFGSKVASSLGPSLLISKSVYDVFDLPLENGARFVDEASSRLLTMVSSRDGSVYVPQIWSTIILLLRRPRLTLDAWPHFKQWILVIQKCFNCSDLATKLQSLNAWNHLVYAIHTNEAEKDMTTFLSKPIFLQLERRKNENPTPLINQAIASYCNLLYYAFRPSAPYERLDLYWSEYICSPFLRRLDSNSNNVQIVCTILEELLWNSQSKVWDEKKAMENGKMKPEDLLRLDCKWVRSRVSSISPIFERLWKSAEWSETTNPSSPIQQMWINLSRALADASRKEIQPSAELMKAIAAVLEILQRLWKDAPASLNAPDHDAFLPRFNFLLNTMISIIEPFPFTNKLLLKTTSDTFQPAQTPTHRRAQRDGIIQPPIIHLFKLIVFSHNRPSSPEYLQLLNDLIRLALSGNTLRNSQIEILRQFAESFRDSTLTTKKNTNENANDAWDILATASRDCLDRASLDTPAKEGTNNTANNDCDKITVILEVGNHFLKSPAKWIDLCDTLVSTLHREKGDIAVSAAIETISESCIRNPVLSIPRVVKLLGLIVFPSQDTVKPLPKFANAMPNLKDRTVHQASCEKLLLLVSKALNDTYINTREFSKTDVSAFLEAVAHCLKSSPPEYRSILLESLQNSLALWIRDDNGQYSSTSGTDRSVILAIRALVSTITHTLESSGRANTTLLCRLRPLIQAGFESRHRSTVNGFIHLWNATFGLQEHLEYPLQVKTALKKLRAHVEILLPSWPDRCEPSESSPPLDFLSSPEIPSNVETPRKSRLGRHGIDKRPSGSPALITPCSSKRSEHNKTKGPSRKRGSTNTPDNRLHHDNSQVHFVPVESSPAGDAAPESQLLTEHQKDVRERQRSDNAILFQSHPSSFLSPRNQGTMAKRIRGQSDPADDRPSTPVVTEGSPADEYDFTFSSPTPGSKEPGAELADFSLSTLPPNLDWSASPNLAPVPASTTHHQAVTPSKTAVTTKRGSIASSAKKVEEVIDTSSRKDASTSRDTGQVYSSPAVDSLIHDWPFSSNGSDMKLAYSPKSAPTRGDFAAAQINTSESPESTELDPSRILDSFNDQLEQQIASQLEQDLELSMDMELSTSKQQENGSKPSSRQRKRKRSKTDTSQESSNKRANNNARVSGSGTTPSPGSPEDIPDSLEEISAQKLPNPTNNRKSARSKTNGGQSTKSSGFNSSTRESSSREIPESQPSNNRRSLRLRVKPAPQKESPVSLTEDTEMTMDTSPFSGGVSSGLEQPSLNVAAEEPRGQESMPDEARTNGTSESSKTSILASLKSVLESISKTSFQQSFLRQIDDIMFDIKLEAHNAVRRHRN
ncbi:hypothetical protein LOZ12_005026 [Ophidiomyces ophidiicola]|uniref:Uncharacterized protein n=1 Tax=Ophidiomyces ophidiicola TaxID=1387563 RepID=A0ACB8USK4_9EURO|nr:uncharacterized protein LOZ57_004046 [Ophidiomyces ophidiicola]KAI1938280.1 hypothetical protein LOZ62_005307 [Ophidiomyces ophidiicola]KAI1945795.1 hypothetical protein LOZ57_004046 [Ophidiomyces ophidiicola]KAI1968266.1 hypothetical protein LOZ56_005131 [Ophidiomyces ophidiicola]KAI2002078.1 hypothetical protein LOZ50_005211 [Ophidiomyces ophidiicola]KAI2012993.1 hypothetical protein LOZ46_005868 [Ophidiomyces ophidiicola]